MNKSGAEQLKVILANTYTLYLKTQNCHWNITGPHFQAWHALFEEQYSELAKQVDEIAERIRMLGQLAPGSFVEYLALTTLSEMTEALTWQQRVEQLIDDHQQQNQLLQQAGELMSQNDDEVTVGLIAELQAMHQKMLWVLRSHRE